MKYVGREVGEKDVVDVSLNPLSFSSLPFSLSPSLSLPLTVVVMELGGQLLRAKSVRGHNLDREAASVHKTIRVEHDLSNHGIVRHHHGHSAKQHLE